MSEQKYISIFNNNSEEYNLIIQKLDQNNYLEKTILSKIERGEKENIEDDIYLSILLIKYKNNLQINIL